jgi:hypothetical protein
VNICSSVRAAAARMGPQVGWPGIFEDFITGATSSCRSRVLRGAPLIVYTQYDPPRKTIQPNDV